MRKINNEERIIGEKKEKERNTGKKKGRKEGRNEGRIKIRRRMKKRRKSIITSCLRLMREGERGRGTNKRFLCFFLECEATSSDMG